MNLAIKLILTLSVCVCLQAQANAQLIRKTGQWVVGKVMREAGEEVVESAARQLARKASKEAIEHSTTTIGRKFIGSALRQGVSGTGRKVGQEVIEKATQKLTAQNARRLAMMEKDLLTSGKAPEVMELIARHGKADQIMEFLWRNKGTIATGAVITTLLANPDAVIGATGEVADKVITSTGKHIAQPLIAEATKPLIDASTIGLTVAIAAVGLAVGGTIFFRFGRKGGECEVKPS